jgi:hypothetical protein
MREGREAHFPLYVDRFCPLEEAVGRPCEDAFNKLQCYCQQLRCECSRLHGEELRIRLKQLVGIAVERLEMSRSVAQQFAQYYAQQNEVDLNA